ncbi:ankyrin repeat domain-containing protein [Aspergillus fijiensis CBS 313.89]|uniref:Ankyrin n=1 Tax=Aspergillus fijiensis CBS 313.89 TaxID=1448319 RepID=A0A8G1RL23_9EURO|nr:ankyrin [Aspergillus fijiensis CBS 313.89]RAK75245.1 ankyrin [Aspergillus fijiensis CBS 313.89]
MLPDLPLELVQMIAEQLDREADLNALVCTTRSLYSRLNWRLYRLNAYRHLVPPGLPYPDAAAAESELHGQSAINWAARHGRLGTAQKWLKIVRQTPWMDQLPAMMRATVTEAVFLAAEHGQPELVRWLLRAVPGTEVNAVSGVRHGDTPLLAAVRAGQHKVVELLLGWEGVDVHARNYYRCNAIALAAEADHVSVLRLLVTRTEADVDARDYEGSSPLWIAANAGHMRAAEVLVRAGADPQDGLGHGHGPGDPPLYAAVDSGQNTLLRLLLDTGRVRLDWPVDRPPVVLAAVLGNAVAVDWLLAAGADPNSQDIHRKTALFHAALGGDEAVVERLLDAEGVDVDLQDCQGCTPLYMAVVEGHVSVVRRLLAAGADPEICNKLGSSPVDLARARSKREIKALFRVT